MRRAVMLTTVMAKKAGVPWYLAGGVPKENCIAAYQPKLASSLANSYINVANPGTYDATAPVAAPTLDANGWNFNGSTQYLDTGIVIPNTQSWSAIVNFGGGLNTDTDHALFGYFNVLATNQFTIYPTSVTGGVRYANGGRITVLPRATTGILAVAGSAAYRNGVAETGAIGAPNGSNTYTCLIGAQNYTAVGAYFSGYIKGIAFYNTVLTPAQVLALTSVLP